jgi:hypothetical protein
VATARAWGRGAPGQEGTMRHASLTTVLGLTVVLAAAAASPVWASFAAKDVFLPSVGSAPGVAPSVWYTTVWVYNPGNTALDVTFRFLARDTENTSPATHTEPVGALEVKRYDDIVQAMFGVKGFGALRVTAEEPIVVVSRIYSQPGGGTARDSVGQFFPGIPAELAIGAGQSTDLLGAVKLTPESAADARYNVGFVETTGHQVSFRVEASLDDGFTWIATGVTLRPFEAKQMSVSALFSNAIGDMDDFRLRFGSAIGDGRAIIFGSRVANGSQDPSTFEMTYLPAQVVAQP